MIKLSHLGFALLALFAVEIAVADESKPVPAATANVAGGWGEVITADAKADALGTSLATLSEDNASIDGVFSGRVGKVCQKQGCWLQLLDRTQGLERQCRRQRQAGACRDQRKRSTTHGQGFG